ncbi:MAG TPA: N-acetylmuramoyl-L-alanine amidase, partial [Candidatus Flavonifractor intestinipullorum]|nr:N-acetylmuramoyl-L-alanine amidase [Candidatus Flavonifractor intestinipullorum]
WTSAQGLEIYTSAGPETAARNVLAADLVARFRAAGVKIRQEPVKHNLNLTVLVQASAPACLIEYGYHTNEEDVSLLKSGAYRDKLARATADGICGWLGVAVEEAPGVPAAPEEPAEWARESWDKAAARGALDGTRPTDPATRQELACALDRLGLLD